MVRFIIYEANVYKARDNLFYIPIWLDLLLLLLVYLVLLNRFLHSNMVRFIIRNLWKDIYRFMTFTFQYG